MPNQRPPVISTEQIKDIAMECFRLKVDCSVIPREFDSYEDRVFAIAGTFTEDAEGRSNREQNIEDTGKFILKIYGTLGTSRRQSLESMFNIIAQCTKKCSDHFSISQPIYSVENRMGILYGLPVEDNMNELSSQKGTSTCSDVVFMEKYLVRLTPYLPGSPVDAKTASDDLFFDCGKSAAIFDESLKDEVAPENAYERSCAWNLIYALENLYDPYVTSMKESKRKRIVQHILTEFKNAVVPRLPVLPRQWIHSDLSDTNTITKSDKLIGFIDIDMMNYSYRVVELAIMMAYFTMNSTERRCLTTARQMYQGYSSLSPLTHIEVDILYNLMLVRFVQSLCIGQYMHEHEDPDNDSLLDTSKSGWDILEYLVSVGKDKFLETLQTVSKKL